MKVARAKSVNLLQVSALLKKLEIGWYREKR